MTEADQGLLVGFGDGRRPPARVAGATGSAPRTVLPIKREKPSWGAPKIRERLLRQYPSIQTPAKSTMHLVLERNGMVES